MKEYKTFIEYYENEGDGYFTSICFKHYKKYLDNYSSLLPFEDFMQDAFIKVNDEWNEYKNNKGGYSTFIFIKVKTLAFYYIRHFTAKKRDGIEKNVSIDQPVVSCDEVNYSEVLCSSNGIEESDEDREIKLIDSVCDCIKNDKHKSIFRDYLLGYKRVELAKKYEVPESYISNVLGKTKRKFKSGYYKIDFK